jgi:Ubiquitin 3 binding protein But2 C-terminal domain
VLKPFNHIKIERTFLLYYISYPTTKFINLPLKPITMHFPAATVSTLALLGFSIAAPTADSSLTLNPRACTTVQPAYISYFQKDPPTESNSGDIYRASRTAGGPESNTEKSVFRFDNIPAGATGCMLQYQLPKGNYYATGDANDVSLFTVKGQVDNKTNWNNQPVKDTKVSSLQVPKTRLAEDYKTIVYASTCPASGSVSFLLEESDWQQTAGVIAFTQGEASGFSMIYNC